ncbi:hypothetical protein Uis4E_0236 [Bifidobacterium parmae]|uniref:Uncharacterized protein n=1 Tax=Bifidobacterium parmae TaxID=361854 RepID=A0A2N5J5V7_9BIFI|nr:hypothetical protein Uis4E_0236 [Bifidobacterium parmae]
MNGGHRTRPQLYDRLLTADSRYPDVTMVIIDMINAQTHNTDIA